MGNREIALVCSEPLRSTVAGIGIRYLAMAEELTAQGFRVRLLSPSNPADVPPTPAQVLRFERRALVEHLRQCDAVIAQGQLAEAVIDDAPDLPLAIDLFDPWLIENLHYTESLGAAPYQNDHAALWLQLARGDRFFCASAAQRLFYLGFLAAVGRVNPERFTGDPTLQRLVQIVPFGVPQALPLHRQLLAPRETGEKRILFGALYDWYDPWPLLDVLATLARPSWKVLFSRSPNTTAQPQRRLAEVHAWASARGTLGRQVEIVDWVPADRRFDLLREVDLVVATEPPSLEAELALRIRFIEAVAASCPVIAVDAGAVAELLRAVEAGVLIPRGDAAALGRALIETLEGNSGRERAALAARRVVRQFAWSRVLEPVVDFSERPGVDWTKHGYAGARANLRRESVRPALLGMVCGEDSGCRRGTSSSDSAASSVACELLVASESALANALSAAKVGLAEDVARVRLCAARLTPAVELERPLRRVDWPGVRLVACGAPLRGAAAWNLLAQDSTADWLVLVDAHARLEDDWCQALAVALSSLPAQVGALSPLALDPSGTRVAFATSAMAFDLGVVLPQRGEALARCALPPAGASVFLPCPHVAVLRREAFVAVGGLDAELAGDAAALDLGWRLWASGWQIAFAPGLRVRVQDGAAAAPPSRAALRVAYKNFDAQLLGQMLPPLLLTQRTNGWAHLSTTELTAMHESRLAVQARRTVPDREIFARFPIHLVRTSGGATTALPNALVESWLPPDLAFERPSEK